jgi:photosystem II stability/assembly factor-like uncharacterized protein
MNKLLLVLTLASFASNQVLAGISVRQLTNNTNDNSWGIRNSSTANGRLFWVDGDDSVIFFDGTTTNLVQTRDSLGGVDDVVFALGTGATAGGTIAVWRRGTDSGWISVDGAAAIPVNATNPIDPANGLNAEGVSVADGFVFMILQAGTFKHVFSVDPASGVGTDLTGNAQVPGAQGRITTSHGQAVWPFQDDTNNVPKLHFFDGSKLQVLDTNIVGNPRIANGRIVYLKNVGGVDQVFLYDSTLPAPQPLQITADLSGTNSFPGTDGSHVAWLHTSAGATNPVIMLYGNVTLTTPDTVLTGQLTNFREHPFQLDRGQLLWEDAQGRLQYCPGAATFPLDLSPGISFGNSSGTPCCIPWLQDGFVAWIGLSNDGSASRQVFRMNAIQPDDARQPLAPLLLQIAPGAGQITFTWDSVIGATSYNLYVAENSSLNQTNYSALPGGRKFSGVTSPFTLTGLTNRTYFCSISTVEGATEGGNSPVQGVPLWGIGTAPSTNYYAIACDLSNGATAYASGGRLVYQTTDDGATWQPLAGGIEGLDVRALAVVGPKVYAASRDFFNAFPAQIFRSTNSGVSWSAVVPDGGHPGELNKVLVLDPTNPARLYAGDFRLPDINLPGDSYVIRSDDGGDSWFHLPNPTEPLGAEIDAYVLAMNPTNSSIIYAGGTGTPNLVRSSDSGTNWTDADVGPGYVYSLAIDPANPGTLYAGVVDFTQTSRGVLKSTNSGATWSSSNTGLPSPLPRINSLLIDARNPQQIHAGSPNGYFVSFDAGDTWSSGDSGLNGLASQISALALTQSRQLLAATAQGVFRLDLSHLNLVIPQLAIEVSGQSALLSWPASAGAFSLQSAPSPDAPVPWATVANPAILTNGSRIVTVDLANAERFFRLFSP